MPYWAKIIPLLLVLSGLIAWLGDELGRRLGKRKVKLWGLRPKKTSVLITIAAGMFTTGVTIAFFAVISENVRIALTSVDLYKAEITKLEKETVGLKTSMRQAVAREREADRKVNAAVAEEARLRQNLVAEKATASTLKKELVALTQEISSSRSVKMTLEKELAGKQKELEGLKTRVKEAQRQRDEVDRQMGALTREYLKQEKKNTELAAAAQGLQKRVAELSQEADRRQKELLHARVLYHEGQLLDIFTVGAGQRGNTLADRLAASLGALNDRVYQRGARYQGRQALLFYEPQLDSLVESMEPGRAYVVRVLSATNVFGGQPVVARFEAEEDRLVFRAGEVIARASFKPGKNVTRRQAESVLQKLLVKGRQTAIKRGMTAGPSGVGQVKASELVRAADSMVKARGPLNVALVARADTYRASVLQVDFAIKPAVEGGP